MSQDIFFISDTHFHHRNILSFAKDDGTLMRPGFDDILQHDELMIERWNAVVKPTDRIYHLGDVTMSHKKADVDALMPRLNGSKRLILGNHDDRQVKNLVPYFKRIGLWRLFKEEGFVCSHISLMESQFRHKVVLNVHGHIHHNLMEDQKRYMNVCVEHTDYRPVHMDEVLKRVREAGS